MTDGLSMPFDLMIVLPPTYTNPKNLELAAPQSVTATGLDQLVYNPNCYIKNFRRNPPPPPQWEVKVAIYFFSFPRHDVSCSEMQGVYSTFYVLLSKIVFM